MQAAGGPADHRQAADERPWALLDDAGSSAVAPTSRLYQGWVREHRCSDPGQLDATWAAVEQDQRRGLQALLLADYEWGTRLQQAGERPGADGSACSLRVLMFERCERLSGDAVSAWLTAQDGGGPPSPAGLTALRLDLDADRFHRAIETIHEAIRAGETYQVNFTMGADFEAFGHPVALYRRLRARQPVPFGALIALPQAGGWVLSCSPELFLRQQDGRLTARPMKGTARREAQPESDSETARQLSLDLKNRAENLMIVDLLRNDLGRIAETGSVQVPDLFTIEPYATVFQMTSTVQARRRLDIGWPQLLRALFPCGSITGAPKLNTMRWIARLEQAPRGLYTGAIGWLDAPPAGGGCGDFCLSVAIRTLTLQPPDAAGLRPGRLGVGAGIVLDSQAEDEWQECLLKARFASGLDPGFSVFETLRVEDRQAGPLRLPAHLARLRRSAAALGFVFDAEAVQRTLAHGLASLHGPGPWRLRLDVFKNGQTAVRGAPLPPLPPGPVRLGAQPLPADLPPPGLRGHKTSWRGGYDAAVAAAEAAGEFDRVMVAADGSVSEGGRSNLFVCTADGRWLTPPLQAGVLPGVMRAELLADPALGAVEARVTLDHLRQARRLIVCNALRGALAAEWVGP